MAALPFQGSEFSQSRPFGRGFAFRAAFKRQGALHGHIGNAPLLTVLYEERPQALWTEAEAQAKPFRRTSLLKNRGELALLDRLERVQSP